MCSMCIVHIWIVFCLCKAKSGLYEGIPWLTTVLDDYNGFIFGHMKHTLLTMVIMIGLED